MFASMKRIEEESWLFREILAATKVEFDFKTSLSKTTNEFLEHQTKIEYFIEKRSRFKDLSTMCPEQPSDNLYADTSILVDNGDSGFGGIKSIGAQTTVTEEKKEEKVPPVDENIQTDTIEYQETGIQFPEDIGETSPLLVLEHLSQQALEYKEEV